jgi:hypothetical protein
MRIYTAHLHARRGPVLVREGWSWGGFIFGPLWLLRHGAVIAALLSIAALAVCVTTAPPAWRPLLCFAAFVLLGLCGNDLRRWSLGLGRFTLAHVVAARSRDDAFLRLLAARPELAAALR